jgi:hypothetical protein
MSCYDEATLRAWLDGQPALHADADPARVGQHVAECAHCQRLTADLQARASVAASAVALLSPPAPAAADIESALAAVRRPHAVSSDVTDVSPRRRSMLKPAAAAAAAAVVFAIVGTPAGRSSASSFLAQFRSERIAVIEVGPEDQEALAGLARLGTVSGATDEIKPQSVDSVAAASERVGFPVAVPDPAAIPPGVGHTPEILAIDAREIRFTLDRERTLEWLATKDSKIDVPQRFDGASIVISLPVAVLQCYPAPDGSPGLVVGQSRQLLATAEGGVSLDELRSFLLSLPGLSDRTRQRLQTLGDWRETLPLPVPAGQVHWKETTIAGTPGLLIGDNTGLGSAALWQRDGFVHGVVVRGKADQVRDVAASLR